MSWTTPTLREVRSMVRDDLVAALGGASFIANSALRIMSDSMAGLAHLVLRYIDWLARQLLPDTAETEWLDRHGDIWLVNADSSIGRKAATLSSGTVTVTGTPGVVVPINTPLVSSSQVGFETAQAVTIGAGATAVTVRALDAGIQGNLVAGEEIAFVTPALGVDSAATVVTLDGGTDEETDEELRGRVLFRIQEPPMGGDANDYVAWALSVPGVTRAWCSTEMGPGTVTVRFMMDSLRATGVPATDGIPLAGDLTTVATYLNTKRPVTVMDFFVEAPVPETIDFTIDNLTTDTVAIRAAIHDSVAAMLHEKAAPAYSVNGVQQAAQTIYAAWVSEAISATVGVEFFDLVMTDHAMPDNGNMAIIGTITYV